MKKLCALALLLGCSAPAPPPPAAPAIQETALLSPAEEALAEGDRLLRTGERESAREAFERALALAERDGDRGSQASALAGIGDSYDPLRDGDQALGFYQRSLELAEGPARRATEARVLFATGVQAVGAEDLAKARDLFEQGVPLAEAAGDTRLQARLFNALGNVAIRQDDYARAEESYRASLRRIEGSGDDRAIARALHNLGDVLVRRDQLAEGMELSQRALAIARTLGEPNVVAGILNVAGDVHRRWADYDKAQRAFREVVELDPPDRSEAAYALNNLGIVYGLQGDGDLSREHFLRALPLLEELDDQYGVIRVLNNLGVGELGRGNPAGALEHFTRARKIAEEEGDAPALPGHWLNIGSAQEARGLYAEADAAYRKSLELAEGQESRIGEAEALEALAGLDLVRQEPGPALEKAGRATAIATDLGERELFWRVRTLAGRALRSLGKREEARAALAEAVATIEQVREAVPGEDLTRQRFLSSRLHPYQEMIGLLAESGDREEALKYAESAKSRALLEIVRSGRGAPTSPTPPFPGLAALKGLIGPDTAVLEYVVLEEKTYLFTLTAADPASPPAIALHAIPVRRDELAREVEGFRRRLAERNLDFRTAARRLHDLLLRPARSTLAGRTKLCIVPDGALWNLPFQALQPTGAEYLLERHAVLYAPSLGLLAEVVGQPDTASPGPLLALGNPALAEPALRPLPEAEKEAREVGGLYAASHILTGTEATERAVKTEAGSHRVLHFATHGLLDDRNPMYSHLLLSREGAGGEDGRLEAWEAMRLRLNADLVVLSACQTARGRLGEGEGVIGLTWALLAAGSRTVVASQWEVDSGSTRHLMVELHRGFLSGLPKSEALRRASLEVLRTARYRHPFYWAGFVLVGDGA